MKRAEHSSAFSALASAKAKFLLLVPSGPQTAEMAEQVRSLHLEHVSPALLVQQEISRRTLTALPREVSRYHLALLRKWFWARKPDAGFLLEGFPATLLQALVFDEWLEARGETLTGCITSPSTSVEIVTHYRTQGLSLLTLPLAA